MLDKFLEYLLKQGTTIALFGVITYLLWQKQIALEAKVDICQGTNLEILTKNVKDYSAIIEKNTQAFDAFSREWKEIKQDKPK